MGGQVAEHILADVPGPDVLVTVLERAAHVHRVVGMDEAQSALTADLDDPVDGGSGAALLVQGRPGREDVAGVQADARLGRSEEHTSELQSLMRISYAVFCLK